MMAKAYFTVDEVNELIPQLEYYFTQMLQHKTEMAQFSHELRRYGVVPQLIGKVPNDPRSEVNRLQSEVRRHYREFKQHLFSIENLGGEIKDLELGRVDFPAKVSGEDYLLTWQLGVTPTAYLHRVPKADGKSKTHSAGQERALSNLSASGLDLS